MGTLVPVGVTLSVPRSPTPDCFKCSFRLKAKVVAARPRQHTGIRAALRFQDLQADDFRHPLDRQNTTLLRTIPGLAEIGKFLLGSTAEQVLLLENIGTSVLVGEDQLADLHNMMVKAANILDLEAPDLYVKQNPVPNAYTLAVSGRKPFVVVHTSLVELLSPEELQAVLAHELGHLKCDHGIWLSFANILALGAYSLPGLGVFLARNLEEQLMRWVRAAELTCDRAALLVAQDPEVVISVLMKLAGGCPSLSGQLSVGAFLKQARSYEEASQSPLGWYLSAALSAFIKKAKKLPSTREEVAVFSEEQSRRASNDVLQLWRLHLTRNAQTKQLSHPLPVLRALEIDQWSRSAEYKALLAQASRLGSARSIESTLDLKAISSPDVTQHNTVKVVTM